MTDTVTYDFTDRVALVTGASSGMGLTAARAYASAGAAVALLDVNAEQVEQAAARLRDEGHRAIGLTCDVTNEPQVADAVAATVAEFGRLDMAFNNAGIMVPQVDAADEAAESFDRVNAVNMRGVWASVKHELRQMRTQGSGSIVNNSSLGGLVGSAGRAAYHSTKHGVIGFTKSVALQYAPLGIRVNAICPGTIETPMVAHMTATHDLDPEGTLAVIPMNRYGTSDEIAAAVLWLSSSASSYVTGVALPVDGGFVA